MAFKPFKPPTLRTKEDQGLHRKSCCDLEPPSKRRKIFVPDDIEPPLQPRTEVPATNGRQPLHTLKNPPSPKELTNNDRGNESAVYFSALWRKFTQKKNKTWDDDGYILIKAGQVNLYDSKRKLVGQGPFSKNTEPGVIFSLGGREIEIGDELSHSEFRALIGSATVNKENGAAHTSHGIIPLDSIEASTKKPKSLKEQMQSQIANSKVADRNDAKKTPLHVLTRVPFKQPLKENTIMPQVPSEKPIPRHDPSSPGALVFPRPKRAPSGQQIVDVVLDPLLSQRLRDHQRDGIKFLYECVMKLRGFGGQGCILADDMGLGKTLQTIALLWTLIKQNPIHKAEPVVKKALIVCPVTLIQNWKKEFRKWLGRDRLGVLTLEDKGSRLSMFDGKNFKVLIVGYERLRNIAEDLTRGTSIDIVVCDEGHRLKTLKNKSAKAIETLNTPKRIILSGTPIQNDLSEFFAMANFVNDGCLGSYKSFVRDFENPIMRSRQPNATNEILERGESASQELAQTTSPFILRRTADILAKYLPSKAEYVLFCSPTLEQSRVYQEVLKSPMFQSALGSYECALQLITILKKLCNSPALMKPEQGNDESTSSTSLSALNEMLPTGISRLYHNRFAAKIRLLDELLQEIRSTTNDKVILVSNYTSTLNLMANLLDSSGGKYLRLDGSVPQSKRQSLVDEFNQSPTSACFAFLLSAKAGGVGLNLIGANRLVLFDVDWNPATDDQAMARIHREGQKKNCKIYRFLIKGGLEERIWQRQIVKRGLADTIMEGSSGKGGTDFGSMGKKGKAAFSREELRDLFRLDESEVLKTHELIGCKCNGEGEMSLAESITPFNVDSDGGVVDIDGLSESSQTFTLPTKPIKASLLTDQLLEDQERRIAQGQRPGQPQVEKEIEKSELMLYAHINTGSVADMNDEDDFEKLSSLEAIIDDPCLMSVLRKDSDVITGRIAYIFKKSTEPGTAMDNESNVEVTTV